MFGVRPSVYPSVVSGSRTNKKCFHKGTVGSLINKVERKREVILNLESKNSHVIVRDNIFRQYANESLWLENIKPRPIFINGIKRGTAAMDSLRLGDITVQDICFVHTKLMSETKPSIAGRIRRHNVEIVQPSKTGKATKEVSLAPDAKFVRELLKEDVAYMNDPSTADHILIHAAISKLNLLYTHPFSDGNGRLGRIVFNTLVRKDPGYPFIVIPGNESNEYYDCIRKYRDTMNDKPYLLYMLFCVDRSLNLLLEDTKKLS